MRALHDGANRDSERLAAILALIQAGTRRLALHECDAVAHDAAMGADGAVRPKPCFDVSESTLFGQELRGGKDGLGHRNLQ